MMVVQFLEISKFNKRMEEIFNVLFLSLLKDVGFRRQIYEVQY